MKVGDKLICKKIEKIDFGKTLISIGKSYEILRIRNDKVEILSDLNIKVEYVLYTDKDKNYYIWNFFISPDEIRLKKLESL